MYKTITSIIFLLLLAACTTNTSDTSRQRAVTPSPNAEEVVRSTPSPTLRATLPPIPEAKTLNNSYHTFQTFNNCGPASMSMALSYYGISKTQQELGQLLRPYQNAKGDNDDKSVTLAELATLGKTYGFVPYLRPSGSAEIIKQFIANDIPVITRTWLKKDDDIGHYRVIKGYDSVSFIQDDSLQGKNLRYTYEDFNAIWKQFGYEYLVFVPEEKVAIAERIIGEDVDEMTAWKKAVTREEQNLHVNSEDVYSRFNLSVALYHTKNYEESVKEFEKIESKLPMRMLWYQIEPILSYYELQKYDRVMSITDSVLNNHNRAFSELYVLRGKIYQKQGNTDKAREEFEKAVLYNKNMKEAHELLSSVSS